MTDQDTNHIRMTDPTPTTRVQPPVQQATKEGRAMAQVETQQRTSSSEQSDAPWWKDTWPLSLAQARQLGLALLVVFAVLVITGETLSNWAAPNPIIEMDEEIAEDIVAGRTESKNRLATLASLPADTPIKIGASIVVGAIMLLAWKRWHEAAFIGLTLAFEATAYFFSSMVVARSRPDVERLVDSPVDTSFPSGHVAAATVYAALTIIVFWHTRNYFVRALAVIIAALIPVAVAWSRMYQGMHYLSDVIVGVLLGLVSVAICYQILGPPSKPSDATVRAGIGSNEGVLS